jgi:2-methylisocitrate lyase-like PEP mutase family enzyme
MATSLDRRRSDFRALHEQGCFLIPNPWDAGSASYLRSLGFKALATTSSGSAFSQGKPDGGMSVEEVLAHIRVIVEATDLPVNADFEHGYAEDIHGLLRNVTACVGTGVAGLSIEDSTGDAASPLFNFDDAVERIRAARAAIDATGADVMLIGRAECFLTGHAEPLQESKRRLVAYAEAGADCLYAPGVRQRSDIEALVQAVAPKPFNLLVGWPAPFDMDEIAAMGVRRVSVGGALAAAAWGGFMRMASELAQGRFSGFANNASTRELNALFRDEAR